MKRSFLMVVLALIPVCASYGALVLDQEQPSINLGSSGEGFLVGSAQEYMLAQTVTAGIDGRLARVELPVVCESGALVVEIRNLVPGESPGVPGMPVPGTTILTRAEVPASEFPPSGGYVFHPIDFARTVPMSVGDTFAIVLRNDTGQCHVGMGLSVDLYARGESVWRYISVEPDVWLSTGGFTDPIDMAFKTYVETGPGRSTGFSPCVVTGFGPLPIPDFVPLCRCVQDPSTRETRCGFLHPSLFLYRTMPSPIRPNETFKVRWTLLAMAPLEGILEIDDVLPKGFQGSKSPLVFFGNQVPVGQSLTLSYEATAGAGPGQFKVETHVTISPDQGEPRKADLHTRIDVAK